MVKPIVVSYDTDLQNPGVRRLQRSLDKWGWPYFIISDRQWLGFGRKLKQIVSYCEGLRAAGKYTHAISIDARDFIAVGPPSEFVAPSVPLLISTEENCWPRSELKPLYPQHSSLWRYAHSPFTVDLNRLDLLRADDLQDYDDDQLHVTKLFLEGKPEIALDYDCRVVQSIAFCQPFYDKFEIVADDRVYNKLTGSYPLFLHGNGGTDMSFFKEVGA